MECLKTLLIANRAEIATRILKTAKCDYFKSELELPLTLLPPDLLISGPLLSIQNQMQPLRTSHRQM